MNEDERKSVYGEGDDSDMVTVSRQSNRRLLNKNLALVQENADLREQVATLTRELAAARAEKERLQGYLDFVHWFIKSGEICIYNYDEYLAIAGEVAGE